ncbi:MAG: histidine phosphatase family protein [Clostridiales bacterium]|nr:histidine phosphatase family protein [Clostridiales bacterium]
MKTIFYLVRHGKTLFNNLGRFQGRCDSELLPEGIEMARRLHDGLKDVDFALAATSTSERAVDTLKGILQEREIPTIYCKGLKEMAFGRLEGALIQLSEPPAPIDEQGYAYAGGEDRREAGDRFRKCLEEIAVEGNVLVVSHAAVIFDTLQVLDPTIDFKSANKTVPNCSVTKLEYSEGKFSILAMPSVEYFI